MTLLSIIHRALNSASTTRNFTRLVASANDERLDVGLANPFDQTSPVARGTPSSNLTATGKSRASESFNQPQRQRQG